MGEYEVTDTYIEITSYTEYLLLLNFSPGPKWVPLGRTWERLNYDLMLFPNAVRTDSLNCDFKKILCVMCKKMHLVVFFHILLHKYVE